MFDWKNAIALHAMQGNRASSRGEDVVSWVFSSCGRHLGRQDPDFNEQTRVSNGHPRCNSRIYPRFLPQIEKTHETFPSLRDEARFPCIVSRAIAFSQSNM